MLSPIPMPSLSARREGMVTLLPEIIFWTTSLSGASSTWAGSLAARSSTPGWLGLGVVEGGWLVGGLAGGGVGEGAVGVAWPPAAAVLPLLLINI
ncbi:MAG: hypothetical protein QXM16_04700, partial [Nitrososphaerota archaeon]